MPQGRMSKPSQRMGRMKPPMSALSMKPSAELSLAGRSQNVVRSMFSVRLPESMTPAPLAHMVVTESTSWV